MNKTIASAALALLSFGVISASNAVHADGTTQPQWDFYAVPQLGHEPVRGTGCGGDGSVGDVITDGYWRGHVTSWDTAAGTLQFDLVCVYFTQQPSTVETVVDGFVTNNNARTRTVVLAPGFVGRGTRVLPDGSVPFFQTTTAAEGGAYDGAEVPFDSNGAGWIYIENGQAQWYVSPPTAGVAVTPAPSTDSALIPAGVIEDGVHFGYVVNATTTSISFDRVDLDPDGYWTNNNPKVRTLPLTAGFFANSGLPYVGQAIEIHVQNQRVTGVYGTDALIYDGEYCGC